MTQGPLRIIRRPAAMGAQTAEDRIKDYFVKLASIAPAEVTGFYLTFRPVVVGNLTPDQVRADTLARWYPWIGVALVIAVKLWATHDGPWWRGQWPAVVISTLAFILWVITMGHYMAIIGDWTWLKDARVATVLAGVFTFVLAVFYKGDPPAATQQAQPRATQQAHAGSP